MANENKVSFSLYNRLYRLLWNFCYVFLFKYSPVYFFKWRVFILKIFGAHINWNSRVYPNARIWSPQNLSMKEFATIGPRATIYNQGTITINEHCIISQDATLCASTHDYRKKSHPLILKPITIEAQVWICAEAFVGPGVSVGRGTILGARAVAKKTLEEWSIYDGNPCMKIKNRVIENG